MSLLPTRRAPPLALAVLAAVALAAPPARPGDPEPLLYAFQDKGRVSLGGTELQMLSGQFDPGDPDQPAGQDRWVDLAVEGADRYALRLDGRVEKNGVLLFTLPFDITDYETVWQTLAVRDGVVHALRADGMLAIDGAVAATLPQVGSSIYWVDLLVVEVDGAPLPLALRADGEIWTDAAEGPAFALVGDPDNPGQDGQAAARRWVRLVPDPSTGEVLALRADGIVQTFAPADGATGGADPAAGTELLSLPFPKNFPKQRDLYVDLTAATDGTVYALRRDGRVLSSLDPTQAQVNLPGQGRSLNGRYLKVLAGDGTFWVLRGDGKVYEGTDTKPALDLPGKRYVTFCLGSETPDLTGVADAPPTAARWRAKAVEGTPLVLPLLASDVDDPVDDLAISVDLTDLPGASFDPVEGTLSWPDPGPPGQHLATVSLDDGTVGSPVLKVLKIKVLKADTKPKNRKPQASKLPPLQVLVGQPLELPVLAVDRDGDALTVTAVPDQEVLAAGAVFDEPSATLQWAPVLQDVGRHVARFTVSDGTRSSKLKIKLDVVYPLQFP